MTRNRTLLVALMAAGAAAAHAESYVDNARVRSVELQYESVAVPRQECTSEWIGRGQVSNDRNYGGAIIGGVVGGVLGNQVGRGHGREAATAVGAVVGALAGDNMANRDRWGQPEPAREVQSCRTVNTVESRLTGYRVGYDWRGQQYSTFMHQQPGPTLPVRVTVEPMVR